MAITRQFCSSLSWWATVALALPLGATAQEIRLGSEFQVNTVTADYQTRASVAASPSGGFVVAWQSFYSDGSVSGLVARRFSSAGTALAAELQVNTYTSSAQRGAEVATDADGDFVVAWRSYGQDGASYGVFARRFSSAGAALGNEFQVNTVTAGSQRYLSMAASAGGDFVVAWASEGQDGQGDGVFAHRFSSTGTALASELQVNTYTTTGQRKPAIGIAGDGGFVIAWESENQDGNDLGIFARRFSSSGNALGGELQVNAHTSGLQSNAAVVVDSGGDFVVAWQDASRDGAGYGVFARRFSSAGAPLGGELQVNTYTSGDQSYPSAAGDGHGGFIVAWQSAAQDGASDGVFARRFSATGAPLAAEFEVNRYTTGQQRFASVAAGAGQFVVAWQSDTQDGSSYGVFAQRFALPAAVDVDGDGTAQPLTDGLLVLRYLFGFRGSALFTGAVGAGCVRCDAASIEAYLAASTLGSVDPPSATPAGNELQVSTYTSDDQEDQAAAASASGDFVVVWQSYLQDGSDEGVFGRRFSSAGAALASEFQVNTYTADDQRFPAVAASASGGFVVVWQSSLQDGSVTGLFARRFSSAGTVLASEFQVNSYTVNGQSSQMVAARANGDFVVVWQSYLQDGSVDAVIARRFSSAGTPLAIELQVNTYTTNAQGDPRLAIAPNGDFLVAWYSEGQDGSGAGIFGRRFSSAGAALAAEFQVNVYTPGHQSYVAVAADGAGDFVVAWSSPQDGSEDGVFARRYSSDGAALAGEFQVNAHTLNDQRYPSLKTEANGDFVVAWQSYAQDGSYLGVFGRQFSSAGAPLASEFQVNTYTPDFQYSPAVAGGTGGAFVVTWTSRYQDGSYGGVFAQRFATPLTLDVDGDGAAQPLTDGLLLLRYLFGFRSTTLTNGAVGAGCTRCDAAAIEAYLAGLTA